MANEKEGMTYEQIKTKLDRKFKNNSDKLGYLEKLRSSRHFKPFGSLMRMDTYYNAMNNLKDLEKFSQKNEYPPEYGLDIKPVDIQRVTGQSDSDRANERTKKTIENIKKQVKYLHDNYHPQIFFLTQTSAPVFGYMIREIYRTAWPDEAIPKMLTINVKAMRKSKHSPTWEEGLNGTKRRDFFEGKFDHSKYFTQIVKDVEEKVRTYAAKPAIDLNEGGITILDERVVFDSTGVHTYDIADRAVRIALANLKIHTKVVTAGLGSGGSGIDQNFRGGSYWGIINDSYDNPNPETPRIRRFHLVRDKNELDKSRKRIRRFKEIGEMVGEELRAEREAKRKGIESTLGIISIAGFLFSIFSFSGITGNVIGINQSINIIKIISILIGLIFGGIYLYLKKNH